MLRVPSAALRFRPTPATVSPSHRRSGQGEVYVLGNQGTFTAVPVTTGIADTAFTEIAVVRHADQERQVVIGRRVTLSVEPGRDVLLEAIDLTKQTAWPGKKRCRRAPGHQRGSKRVTTMSPRCTGSAASSSDPALSDSPKRGRYVDCEEVGEATGTAAEDFWMGAGFCFQKLPPAADPWRWKNNRPDVVSSDYLGRRSGSGGIVPCAISLQLGWRTGASPSGGTVRRATAARRHSPVAGERIRASAGGRTHRRVDQATGPRSWRSSSR